MNDFLARCGCLISRCGLLLAMPGLAIAARGLAISKRFATPPDPRLQFVQDRVLDNVGLHCLDEVQPEARR